MYHFIISDKHQTNRREQVIQEFEKLGIVPNFIDAIMGKNLSEEELASVSFPDTFLRLPEIGCALSHLACYKKLLESDHNSVFIFEDDMALPSAETALFKEIQEFVDALEYPALLLLQKSKWYKKKVHTLSNGKHIYTARNAFCTHGYIINKAAAKNILEVQTPLHFEIDAFKFYYWLDVLTLFCLDFEYVGVSEWAQFSSIQENRSAAYRKRRKKIKDAFYLKRYQQLSWKGKIKATWRQLEKCIYRPFETLDY